MIEQIKIWSDDWAIDGEKGWFVSSEAEILFCYDFDKEKLSLIDVLPVENKVMFRSHQRCIKVNKYVYCLPDKGKDIFRYDLSDRLWKKIIVPNIDGKRIGLRFFREENAILQFISLNGNIFVLDENTGDIIDIIESGLKEEMIVQFAFDGSEAFLVSGINPSLYFKSVKKDRMIEKSMTITDDILTTIVFDNKYFWCSGYNKKIYRFDRSFEHVDIINNFPANFGEYDFYNKKDDIVDVHRNRFDVPMFVKSVFLGGKVWFIPLTTNEIVYIDEESSIKVFHVEETVIVAEDEQYKWGIKSMYIVQYEKEDRYLGLYSIKLNKLIEVDAKKMTYRIMDIKLNDKQNDIYQNILIDDKYKRRELFHENDDFFLTEWIKYVRNYNNKK